MPQGTQAYVSASTPHVVLKVDLRRTPSIRLWLRTGPSIRVGQKVAPSGMRSITLVASFAVWS